MKKIIKYMIFILAIFLINISSINAEEYNGVIEKGEAIDGIYYYKTREDTEEITYPTHSFHEAAHIYRDSINHNIVYCIESWKPLTGATSNDFKVYDHNVLETNLSDEIIEEINLIAYYGYGYKDERYDHTSPEWYAITQLLIWKIQAPNYKHYIVNSLTSTTSIDAYSSKMGEINTLIKKHKNKLSLFNYKMKINSQEENPELMGKLKYYELDGCDDGIDVTIEENKVIIKSLNKVGEFSYSLRRKFNKWNKKMKIYVSNNYQNVFEPGDMNDDIVTKTISIEPYKLEFSTYLFLPFRINEDGKDVYTTYFFPNLEVVIKAKNDIYDGAGNLIYKKGDIFATTKSSSTYTEIPIIPGTFELQIVKSIPGIIGIPRTVEINKSNVSTNIILNKTSFIINAHKVLEQILDDGSLTTIPGENISIGLYAAEDIKNFGGKLYAKKDQLIRVYNTDEFGNIQKKDSFLLAGKYYLKEITELDNYEINEQKYEFELSYDEEFKEIIETEEVLIENKLKTGKIGIKKLDAIEFFPLENVSYSLYSKNHNLLETKRTNSFGDVEFDVKMGEYYIKENKALDGYIKDDKTYYINVDYTNPNPTYKLLNERIENEVKPTEPTEKQESPIKNNEDSKEQTKLPNEKQENSISTSKEEIKENNEIIEEINYNKEEDLIVNVPSTNVYNYDLILLFLLSITFISIKKCIEN
ncbi:MAG: Cys-Gln thioester bond-forming surface protein [Bacilli bacterium]|nr:Cys-Gln thioester bond-forming surface protein [Bacilli bacterium]